MENDVPIHNEVKSLKELIRVKIDIYGLTKEDIEFFRAQSIRIMSERIGARI